MGRSDGCRGWFNLARGSMNNSGWQKGSEGVIATEDIVDRLQDPSNFLYFGNRRCPFAHRVWWAARERGIKLGDPDQVLLEGVEGSPSKRSRRVEYLHIDLPPPGPQEANTKPAWYQAAVNPAGSVPCLYDGGEAVFESLVIAEYLDEKVGGHRASSPHKSDDGSALT